MKHLLNDLTEKEKNSIREQHTGGMNVVTENFSKLINAKSGDVKPLVNEQPGSNMANAIGSLVKSTQNVYKKYPQYHDKDGNMIGELGKMEEYVMATWRKMGGGDSFSLDPNSTDDTHSITNGGRKVVWDFKQKKIFFEKDFLFDPNPLPLNSNFNVFKTWFDKDNKQSNVSDLGWLAKSVVKQGLGLKESDSVRLVKRIINEREGEDSENFAKWQDSRNRKHIRYQMLLNLGIHGEKAKQLAMDDKYKDMSWDDIKKMRPRLKKKGESPSDCEHLFKSMDFIYDDYMSQISLSPDEISEAEAEDIYDEFKTELAGIIDEANQTECDDKTVQDLEIECNQYLSDMANKLGLVEDDMPSYKTKWSEPSDDDM